MTDRRFTVAICTRNRARFLRRCLDGLLATLNGLQAPILLVDNASTDNTRTVATCFAHRVQYVVEPMIGLSHARNRALSLCTTEYLAFLDDDGVPGPSWGQAVAAVAEAGEADIFGGPYRPFYTDPKPIWFDDSFGSAHLDLKEGRQERLACFSGGNMGWRTALLHAEGGFDPGLGVAGRRLRLGEETAVQIMLQHKYSDLNVQCVPNMSMAHHVSKEKMRLSYIFRRNYLFGWQLRDIDPLNAVNKMSIALFARQTRLGLPLLMRLVCRDRGRDPYWRSYAARYLTLNSIMLGAQVRRWFGPRPRSVSAARGTSDRRTAIDLGQ